MTSRVQAHTITPSGKNLVKNGMIYCRKCMRFSKKWTDNLTMGQKIHARTGLLDHEKNCGARTTGDEEVNWVAKKKKKNAD